MVGREKEIGVLMEALESNESQFIVVYGRRRIGKTMLVREAYAGRFTFLHTGLANVGMAEQLAAFRDALCEYGLDGCGGRGRRKLSRRVPHPTLVTGDDLFVE